MVDRATAYSYRCNVCRRCCYNKRIQLNPYEIARLAANRGLDSTTFLATYTEAGGAVLKVADDGACVFLGEQGCTVHPDRPLVCRLYPLGRIVDEDGTETFHHLEPHPETEGEYGEDGTVDGFLREQDAAPFMEAADRYLALLRDSMAALKGRMTADASVEAHVAETLANPLGNGETVDWYDVDRVVAEYVKATGTPSPASPEEKLAVHIQALEAWIAGLRLEESHEGEKEEQRPRGQGRAA